MPMPSPAVGGRPCSSAARRRSQAHERVDRRPLLEGLIDARFLAALPRGASLVNLARGAHVVETDLLAALARARGRVKSREQLLEEIRDRNYDVFDRSIDVHISTLRRKLGDDPKNPRYVKTVRGAGYRFSVQQ